MLSPPQAANVNIRTRINVQIKSFFIAGSPFCNLSQLKREKLRVLLYIGDSNLLFYHIMYFMASVFVKIVY